MGKKYYYKAMDKDMKCLGVFQYKIGETYTIESKELRLCSDSVFHFCERLEDTSSYYVDPTDRHFLIEALGDIVTEGNKSGSNKIRIVKEITREETEEYIQDKDSLNAKRFLALYTTNVEMLETLYKDKKWRVRCAENLNIPTHILKKLAKDKEENVRYYVAANVNTPVHILEKLAKDETCYVRRAVAENVNTSLEILEQLAKDEDTFVRESVAENPNTQVYLLEELIKEEYWIIRCAVAKNPNTTIDMLERLSKDLHENVRNEAQARLREIA